MKRKVHYPFSNNIVKKRNKYIVKIFHAFIAFTFFKLVS
jgi:hypothetical protein